MQGGSGSVVVVTVVVGEDATAATVGVGEGGAAPTVVEGGGGATVVVVGVVVEVVPVVNSAWEALTGACRVADAVIAASIPVVGWGDVVADTMPARTTRDRRALRDTREIHPP